MTDLMELFRRWHAGRSQVQISTALGINRKTIRKYLAPALAAGWTPGEGGKFDETLWRELISGWFPEVGDPAARAVTWPVIAAHRDWINGQLKASVTVATIAQRLRDDHGVAVSESTVRRYVAAQFADEIAETKVTVPRGADGRSSRSPGQWRSRGPRTPGGVCGRGSGGSASDTTTGSRDPRARRTGCGPTGAGPPADGR